MTSLRSSRYFLGLTALCLILPLLTSCAFKKEKKLEKGGLTLMYPTQASAGSEVNSMQLNHPLNISEDQVRAQLAFLFFEELSLMGKKRPVFAPESINTIAPLIAKGIRHLKPGRLLFFEWESPKGTTSGHVFIVGSMIHWRFDSIQGMDYASSTLSSWGGNTWRLTPIPGQAYHVSKKILGERTNENWIFSKQDLSVPKRIQKRARKLSKDPSKQSEPPEQRTIPGKKELEQKLKFLKDLRDKDLIGEEEYQQKREELLNKLL
ncbi:MAG: SHOCT domain-containing protein [Candidatus Nitrohelix vancouverensis]|uniref:SHOCT domain-containing protein n=1 Tax=Candidatus Nitrohelix vancouverensis TaxID=2705534 RepID=A0A7T0BZN1_9BACT|nr:MAG: SHOCT domain-containing protein [Candidatus Nitrohelix vancouverensis]